jgi:amino acid adenylation domain-containing protein
MDDSRPAELSDGLSAIQREQLAAWNQTLVAGPPERRLHRLFAAQAQATPDALAIAAPRALSYAQLIASSEALARLMCARGVRRGDMVGIWTADPVEAVIGCCAALFAGAAFVPMDEGLPAERARFMLEDSNARALLTDPALLQRLGDSPAQAIGFAEPTDSAASQPLPETEPDDIAYVIYTSGSTGKPKGVSVRHRNITNFATARTQVYGPAPIFLPAHSLAFDPAIGAIAFALATGGSLALCDAETRRDPEALRALIARASVTHISTVPTAYEAILGGAQHADMTSLRACTVGGEPLPPALVTRHYRLVPGAVLYNEYGPTETTVSSSVYPVPQSGAPEPLPIGRPVANTTCYVLDERGRLLPPGQSGELYIGGEGVAAGYLNRPELTAERFLRDPFVSDPDARMYRTGDRARWLPDGQLEFQGRIDFQVKVRGYRVELPEIEHHLMSEPGVASAVVLLRDTAIGSSLAAYYTTTDGAPRPELKAALARKLPGYMVPTFMTHLPQLPMNMSGKVDRKALPEPVDDSAGGRADGSAPSTSTEQQLAEIWRELLGVSQVFREDDFFVLGGHSLLATMVVSRVRDKLGLRVPVRDLFAAPVLRDFASAVEREGRPVMGLHTTLSTELPGPVPIAPLQETFWYLAQIEPNSAAYVVRARFRIAGELVPERLATALRRVVADNEVLRTRFVIHQGEPVQVVVPELEVPLEQHDLRGDADPEGAAKRLLRDLTGCSFDLARCPLLRCQLLRLSERDSILELAIHHIIFDGWSVNLFIGELFDAYSAEGEPAASPRRAHYRHHAHDARTRLDGIRLEELRGYWRAQMKDLPAALSLPTDFQRPTAERRRSGQSVRAQVPAALTHRVRARCAELGTTHFVFCLAVFKAIVTRWTGEHDVVVGTPMAVRDDRHLEAMIGCFINSIVLRTAVPELTAPFTDLLLRVKRTVVGGLAHAEYPFDWLVVDLRTERTVPGDNPLFRLFFNDIDRRRLPRKTLGIELAPEPDDHPISKFDLTFYIHEWHDHDEIDLVYDPELFSADTMRELVDQFQSLLDQVCHDPSRALGSYSLLTERARRLLPDPATELRGDHGEGLLQETFYELAASNPERSAIVDDSGCCSYGELAERSNAIAAKLIGKGANPDDRVAVFAARGVSLVAALLGTLESGCTFTVLDPDQPAAWNIGLLEALGTPIWLAAGDREVPAELARYLEQHVPTRIHTEARARSSRRASVARTADAAAYVGFTSGTTGGPKGVVGSHRPVVHFLKWYARHFALNPSDRVSMLSGLGHDPLLRDIFAPLSTGATLCIPSAETRREPALLWRWLEQNAVSVVHLTPGLGTVIGGGQAKSEPLSALRLLLFGGERLRAEDVALARGYAPRARVVNCYGTTETPQVMGYHEVPAELTSAPAIGAGIDDAQLLVRNPRGERAGIGELGAILVRSPYLSRGYLAGAGLDVAATEGGVYATGDLGRYDAGGQLRFVGRPDRQVKVRGYRIELSAIESALEGLPAVARAHVLARPAPDGSMALEAYVVCQEPGACDARGLRRALEKQLIEAMIPGSFAFLERFPLTANGKIDTRRLLAEETVQRTGRPEYRPPRSQTEEIIARLWAELFELAQVGTNDDFFELGGHSLLAVRMVTLLSERLGSAVPLRLLMQHSTVGRLAEALHQSGSIEAEDLVVELRTGGSRPPFWMIHPVGGHVVFARRFVSLLHPEQNVLGIQARGLDGRSEPFESIPEMAKHYLELIRKRQPSGPYYIGGPSLGGKVAYEIAQQLLAGGERAAMVVMFDTFAPGFPSAKPALGWLRDKLGQALELGFKDAVVRAGQRLVGRHVADKADGDVPAHLKNAALAINVRKVALASERASRSYDVQPYSGIVTLFRAGTQPEWPGMDFSDPKNGWGRYVRRVDVEVVDAEHQQIFDEPCVFDTARRFEAHLLRAHERVSMRSSRLSTMGGKRIRTGTTDPPVAPRKEA